MADVSPQAISQYEHGHSSPSPEVLRRLASTVNLPEPFFLLPPRSYDRGTIFYRSMSSTTKGARARAERRFTWLRDIRRYLAEYVALPEANFPDLGLPDDPLQLSSAEIEDAAAEVRSYWGLRDGPIANMVLLLENHGAVIARDRLEAESLDGLSEWCPEESRPYIVVAIDKGSPARWRFDVAHELSHIVLHAHVKPELLAKSDTYRVIENQAHRFAGAFLLPFVPFSDELFGANLDAFEALKPKWKVAISMMITRARQCDLIGEETQRRLMINLSRHGWRRREPYDDTMEIEEPRVLRRSFELILENGAQTPDDILAALRLRDHDVETLSGLPSGYLSGYTPVTLRMSPADSAHSIAVAGPAEIINLPRRPRT
jgi:Zn-dependent peptidase ImmA (M78 family)/transcriptional regulator with XRE-family HTH domain